MTSLNPQSLLKGKSVNLNEVNAGYKLKTEDSVRDVAARAVKENANSLLTLSSYGLKNYIL